MSRPVSNPTSHSATSTAQPSASRRISPDPLAELKALINIMQSSVEQIEATVTANSFNFPSPDLPFSFESEAPRMHPAIASAGALITSAASQLITLVRPAPLTLLDLTLQFHVATALRTVASTHVAEILRDAGPKGKHVREIAKPTKVHSGKLARILRLLATNHIFTEVSPDVFTNNRLSSVLDTGKSVEELLTSPESKHIGTHGMTSVIEHILDEGFKASSYLTETIFDPELGHASAVNKTAFNKAHNVDDDFWTWIERPDQRLRLVRFGAGMNGVGNMAPKDTILEGYPWAKLPEGSLIVDVGGGVGSQSLTLASRHPHLRFVIQDRESVVADAAEFWKQNMPDALDSGRVKLQAHNFFEPQPAQPEDTSVFLVCKVFHDWADDYCLTILKHLRAAAGPKTQLLIVDHLVACACDEPATHEIPGAETPVPPKPLLPNLGVACALSYDIDVLMMEFNNGQERTITYLRDLLDQSGWKLTAVSHDPPSAMRYQKAIAVPK